jgi:gliding motility-associated-like protein
MAEKIPGCYVWDTIRVNIHYTPPIDLGNDTSFCKGGAVLLDAGSNFVSYQWSTGSTSQTILANTSGLYGVTAITAKGCKSVARMSIAEVWNPVVHLDKNNELCEGSSRLLDAGAFHSYQWHDGSNTRSISVSNLGMYYVEVVDVNGCKARDTIIINTILPQPKFFLDKDTVICNYENITLKPNQFFTSYLWNVGSTAGFIQVHDSANYWLEVKDLKGCIGRDSILVTHKGCPIDIHFPNAITPNADNRNDVFKAIVFGRIKSFQLTIYNRWGQVVYVSSDPAKGWNGQVNGVKQDTGVFVWHCTYELTGDAGKRSKKGTVTLIR